jgi:ADP-ribose pyrophosphatase YjhB (NUDIX family)
LAKSEKGIAMQEIRGVGLFLNNEEGLFYAIKEMVEKRSGVHKNPGDLSIPLETLEKNEKHPDAISRLFREEVDQDGIIRVTPPLYIGEYVRREHHRTTTVFLYSSSVVEWDGRFFAGSHAGDEYTPHGFISKEELIRDGRKGIPELFTRWDLYMAGLET